MIEADDGLYNNFPHRDWPFGYAVNSLAPLVSGFSDGPEWYSYVVLPFRNKKCKCESKEVNV